MASTDGLLRLRGVAQRLRSSLWFLPTVTVVAAIILAVLLVRVEVDPESWVATVVFGGGASGARGMLEAVAGSVITVTSLVFTMTVVTLQLASSQFSPRLLRTFLRDRGNQVVLSLFLATFAYSLTVLRTIRAADEGGDGFVPQVAVTGGFLLAMASVAALVYFVHHITQEIRVDTMMQEVERDTRRTIDHVYPEALDAAAQLEVAPAPPASAAVVSAQRSGFLQDIAVDTMAERAVERGLIVRLHAGVGQSVSEGAPLLWVWTDSGDCPSEEDLEHLERTASRTIVIGHERTEQRDVAFGVRQMVDIAAKALSPGINDPTTAVHAIVHLSSILCVLARRQLDALVRRGPDGVVRVAVARPGLDGYLDLACGQIRRYGAGEPAVSTALLEMLAAVASCSSTDQARRAISQEAAMIVDAAERSMSEPQDMEQVRTAAHAVERALDGDLRP